MKLLRLEILLAEELEDVFAGFLAQRISWGWEIETGGPFITRFVIYFATDAHVQDLIHAAQQKWPGIACTVSSFEDRDWSESWKEFFVPVPVHDTFMVLPPWLNQDRHAAGLVPLYIEPKMAFGTGHHATTALCLKAVAMLWQESAISEKTVFLDLGTGSGILALACAKLGLTGHALDIDPVAVDNAHENLALNNVADRVTVWRGGLEYLQQGQRFGLVLANILAGPLVHMAKRLVSHSAKGGYLVLSGILQEQADRVENAYLDQGLPAPRRLAQGEWVALIWNNSFP